MTEATPEAWASFEARASSCGEEVEAAGPGLPHIAAAAFEVVSHEAGEERTCSPVRRGSCRSAGPGSW